MDPAAGTLQKAAAAAVDLHEFEDYASRADALLRSCAADAAPRLKGTP